MSIATLEFNMIHLWAMFCIDLSLDTSGSTSDIEADFNHSSVGKVFIIYCGRAHSESQGELPLIEIDIKGFHMTYICITVFAGNGAIYLLY